MTAKELRDKALALHGRKVDIDYEGLKFTVHEPSYKLTKVIGGMEEDEVALFLVRECVSSPGSEERIFLESTDAEIQKLPMGLVAKLANGAASFLKEEAAKVVEGNS